MKIILLFLIVILFSANIAAQDKVMKRYPLKSAVLSYKLSGDYEGIKTVYIDDFGNIAETERSVDFSLSYLRDLSRIKDEHSKKGPFVTYLLENYEEFTSAGQKTLYLVYTKKEDGEPDMMKSLLTFNFNGK